MIRHLLFYLALVVLPVSLKAQTASADAKTKLRQMEWLLGSWTRTNAKPGRTASEEWAKVNETAWMGRGINMRGLDTTFVEKLKIVIENDKLFYVADVPENKKLVYFEMTSVTADGFVCENPQHDFPKKIAYKRNGNKVTATISGGDKSIDYLFEKKN